ncbi:MAG: peptide ABC transporter substrate-binding protein, partial [Candidatus Eremiobacteraeota bacterium]|nr:peptide ABC transporter substrate-binding protein [Candidatus Eremiobacteraeota bacterium]
MGVLDLISRRSFVGSSAGAAVAAGLGPAPLRAAERQRHPYTTPHVLRYATASEPGSLNPVLRQEYVLSLISQLTMAWLFRYDRNNRPVPELATEIPTKGNGGISKDGQTLTFRLRKGVVWSDGAPFTAKDVVFSWKVVMDFRNNITSRRGWDYIKQIDTPDDYTAIFRLTRPFGSFIPTFFGTAGANPCILPHHVIKDTSINEAPYNALPIGIGPFKYERWARAQEIVMVANDKYWRGRPKLDKVIYKLIPDRNTVLTQLQAHEIDLWAAATAPYWDRIRAIPGIGTLKQPGGFFDHLDFNMQSPLLRERAVREALRYAIDRRKLTDTIYHGVGLVQEPMLSPLYQTADTSIPLVPFDPNKANALLEGAGWKRGPDGIRAKDGAKLSVSFATSSGAPDADQQIELIRAWWKDVGVDISLRHYPPPMMFATYQDGGIVYGGKWDVTGFAWLVPPTGDLQNLYSTAQIPPHGQNDVRYSNPKVDAAFNRFEVEYDVA